MLPLSLTPFNMAPYCQFSSSGTKLLRLIKQIYVTQVHTEAAQIWSFNFPKGTLEGLKLVPIAVWLHNEIVRAVLC